MADSSKVQSVPDEKLQAFLKHVPSDGSRIGNGALRALLKWTDDEFWSVRSFLIEKGTLLPGRGKGGSCSLAKPTQKAVKESAKSAPAEPFKCEDSLYDSFLVTVRDKYTADTNIEANEFVIAKTARQGSKATKGKWTRPDISLIAFRKFSFVPGTVLDIITFEIKHYSDFDASGVYEAAAHNRFSNKSFLAVYLPRGFESHAAESSEDFERILADCNRLGVGFLHFANPGDYDTYEIVVEPHRHLPDPYEQDQFIRQQIPAEKHASIQKAIRG